MHLGATIVISVILMTAVAAYGAWVLDWEADNQFTHHPNAAQQMCMEVASQPGYTALLSVTTDVEDDRPPDAWPKAWLIAPVSGGVWGVGVGVFTFSLSKLGEIIARRVKQPKLNKA